MKLNLYIKHGQEGKNWQCCKSSFLKLKMTGKVI